VIPLDATALVGTPLAAVATVLLALRVEETAATVTVRPESKTRAAVTVR
jgi:hypothetical protein